MASDELRTERLEIRLSPSEKERLLKLADAAGMSVAAVVRALSIANGSLSLLGGHDVDAWSHVRDYAQYMSGVRTLSAEVAKTRVELRRIGVNANQIARSLNSGRSVGIEDLVVVEALESDLKRGLESLSRVAEAADTLAVSYERLGGE